MLTPTTSGTKFNRILKQTRPIETTLMYFSGYFPSTKMTSTSLIITKGKYTPKVMVWDTPPNNLVWTIFKEIGVMPKEIFDLREEF